MDCKPNLLGRHNTYRIFSTPNSPLRWRLFGDISQERQVSCRALCWLHSMVVVCSGPEDNSSGGSGGASGGSGGSGAGSDAVTEGYELMLFPRYHLDMASVLCRYV